MEYLKKYTQVQLKDNTAKFKITEVCDLLHIDQACKECGLDKCVRVSQRWYSYKKFSEMYNII
jgi:hypothetical protein